MSEEDFYKREWIIRDLWTKWCSIDKKNVPLNQKLLAYSEGADRIYIARCPSRKKDNEHWIICEEDCSCVGLTGPISHWMPLPDPPTKEKDEE